MHNIEHNLQKPTKHQPKHVQDKHILNHQFSKRNTTHMDPSK
jgi:hypothetical protein